MPHTATSFCEMFLYKYWVINEQKDHNKKPDRQ